ncbi:diguanylate cyclase [Vibrio sp. CAU 1672]|uniref:sensor domain-containing diguanylate cyclase n=1 Tax=Vibrio sp. CAU 1672 TaxID=3032594 RepID=UPI0023DA43B8|nr:diguanylate cyclase [Vibrio sp. CAU 1672]MDF2153249.1 diguanylate cyclase [Vibrio sp. CAU 1672]
MKIRRLIGSLLTTTLFFSAFTAIYYHQQYQALVKENVQNTAIDALQQLAYTGNKYNDLKAQIASISDLLGHSQSLYDYIQAPSRVNLSVLEEVWSSVAINQNCFSQLRFVDLAGHEKVGINYDVTTGIAEPALELKDQSSSLYFKYAQGLQDFQVGSWPMELSQTDGQFTYPYHPFLRVMLPIAVNGERKGYLFFHLDVRYLTERLNYSLASGFQIEMLDKQGNYIASPYSGKLYGQLLPERAQFNLKKQSPAIWQRIEQMPSGYIESEERLLVYQHMHFQLGEEFYLLIDLSEYQLQARAEKDAAGLMQEAFFVLSSMLIFALPVTALATHYRRYSIEAKLARAALDGMSAVVITDTFHRIMLVNQEFENMMGYANHRVEGWHAHNLIFLPEDENHITQIRQILCEKSTWEGEVRCRTQANHIFTAIMRIQAIKATSGKVSYYIISLVDISERKKLEEQLRHLSEKDGLTGLWNRRKFEEQLMQQANMMERYPEVPPACLALIDIDHFKRINDQCGHDEGDNVIRLVAEVLSRGVRSTDFVARVGGEEFAVIMPHTNIEEGVIVLNRLRKAVERHPQLSVTISVGFSDLTANQTRTYKCADIALYESKSSGRNCVSLCESYADIA